ncbi:MAG: Tellurite resistance protein TerB, partial [Epsilonproteobacteria bacterium]|nr:Tellurite resistance protein TerB [Campylobacterota bacterium]
LTNDLRETAFVLAVEMVLADGLLHRNEEVFIDQLADSLGVDEQTAHQAIKITLIKMRSA